IAIIGILAAIAIPAYQDYTTRAKMTEVINYTAAAKTAVTECLNASGLSTDCDTNTKVGLDAPATLTTTYVEKVTVGDNSIITTDIQGTNVTPLNSATLTLTPTASAAGVTWVCEISSNTLNKYVPTNCRAS